VDDGQRYGSDVDSTAPDRDRIGTCCCGLPDSVDRGRRLCTPQQGPIVTDAKNDHAPVRHCHSSDRLLQGIGDSHLEIEAFVLDLPKARPELIRAERVGQTREVE